MGEVGTCVLWSWSSVHQGYFSGNLPLETEMGSLFIPASDGGGDIVHSLDSLHDPNRDSSREVGDEGGGIFDFVILGADDIQFELVDIFLKLFSVAMRVVASQFMASCWMLALPKEFSKLVSNVMNIPKDWLANPC